MRSSLGQGGGPVNIQPQPNRSIMNKTVHVVLRRAPVGSGTSKGDRRVRRTRQALTHALVELVLEKRYDAITIQDLLDRADVGRSTFYAHYRSKDDLLFRSFESLLEALDQAMGCSGASRLRLAPARELFHHIDAMGDFHRALARAHMLDRVYQTGTSFLSRTIARRLAATLPGMAGDSAPLGALAHAFAGALFAMLRWWVDHGAPCSPERMDDLYHMVRLGPGLPSPAGS